MTRITNKTTAGRFARACLVGCAIAMTALLSGCGGGGGSASVNPSSDLISRLAGTKWKAVSVGVRSETDNSVKTDACPGSVAIGEDGSKAISCTGNDTVSFSRVQGSDSNLDVAYTKDGVTPPPDPSHNITYQANYEYLVQSATSTVPSGSGETGSGIGTASYVVVYSITFSGSTMTMTQASTTGGTAAYNGSSVTYQQQ